MSKEISYACGISDKPLLGDTIGDKFDEISSQYSEREAIVSVHQDIRLTYNELAKKVNKLSKAFISSGFQKGHRVGIWSSNNVEWLITQYAAAKVGVILVTINPAYRSHELEYVLSQSGCSGIILQNQFKTSDYESMICEICPEVRNVKPGELKSKQFKNLTTVISMTSSEVNGIFNWEDFLNLSKNIDDTKLEKRQEDLDADDAINIQYTSGTTGFPKGATLSHHNILNNGYFTGVTMNFTQEDRLVVPVPLYHCFGMVLANLACLTHGACVIYPSEGFEPALTLKAVQDENATALHGVPTMFIAELALSNFKEYDLTSLRTGLMAGSPCPIETMKQVIELMHMSEVEIAYGMTETSPVSFQTKADSPMEKRVGTVGSVHPHVEVKIIDSNSGKICTVGQTGELCTRGYSVMLGYWENPEGTNAAIDSKGWMHTGDTAVMDEDGYVNIVGRIKDMIVRGGENIYPVELEDFLMAHDAIEAVQVTGVPDSNYGEEIIAWISLKEGKIVSEDAIKEFCKGKLAHYKVPRYIRFSDDFPMTVTGKVQKYKMREISIKELGLKELETA